MYLKYHKNNTKNKLTDSGSDAVNLILWLDLIYSEEKTHFPVTQEYNDSSLPKHTNTFRHSCIHYSYCTAEIRLYSLAGVRGGVLVLVEHEYLV